ncbi:hypothetical protein HanXRQr2_Chr17g0819031 [Helianthus annuus]|uniref:Uncharacterized protein n=1 Tax=Helianthus annuus TaxID=4232 RepID=A0A9K3GVR1_HELAN|nr:hypothetical protein HanXRQr2_Chr17g0819031 [Helianthus annuus]KAJ0814679.1 hypothetical protein HanPSC8_Chr17g0788621 [Helianthus annuus]
MIIYVLNCECTRVDLICFFVGDLQLKLLFNGHYDLHIIQAVQPKILLEMNFRKYLRRIHFGEALDDVEDSVNDLSLFEMIVMRRH